MDRESGRIDVLDNTLGNMNGSSASLENALQAARVGDRVCPLPQPWQALYDLLPGKERRGQGWNPPLPLILGAWHFTGDAEKSQRFQEHIVWAAEHNVLDTFVAAMDLLEEVQWHHRGE